MKYNFKKIASILAGTVMLSSTLAFAAAANYPAPFVKNGTADVAVVYGSMPGAEFDYLAVADITNSLSSKLAAQTASSGSSTSGTSVSGGDFVKLERSSDKFNLGDAVNEFYATMDDDQLGKVLASGVYTNDDNIDFDYDQSIVLATLNLTHFQEDDNSDNPTIGFNLASGDAILNYTLKFTPDAAEGNAGLADLEKTELPLLGRNYYIATAQNTTTGVKLTLLDTANSATVKEGETQTVTVGNKSYEVSTSLIDSDEVTFVINGVNTGKKLQEGDVHRIDTDTYVAVKNVNYNAKESGISNVDFSIGTGRIVLDNNKEVQINNEAVSDITDSVLNAYINNTNTDINNIKLEWILDEDAFITANTSLVFPGFETIKLSTSGFNVAQKEMTSLEGTSASASQVKLSTELTEGTLSGFHILYANSTDNGFTGIGKDSTHVLLTNGTSSPAFLLNETQNNYFAVTWTDGADEGESYVFEVSSITDDSGKNATTLNSLVSGGKDVTIREVGDDEDVGSRITLTLVGANDNQKWAYVRATPVGGSGTVYGDRLITNSGLQMRLPVNNATINAANGTNGYINLSSSPSTWVMNFTEEDKDDTIARGPSFIATLGFSSDGAQVSSVGGVTELETADGSDNFEGYVGSDLATRTLRKSGGDQDSLDIEYHGSEAFADVVISESGAVISSSGEVIGSGSVKELGSVSVTDANVPTGKNLIVVGGSCVNRLAAELIGGAGCGSAWEAKTGVGSNAFLIQSFDRSGKIATLVAGYGADDTRNAAKVFTSDSSIDLSAGKKYKSTSATAVAMVSGNSTA